MTAKRFTKRFFINGEIGITDKEAKKTPQIFFAYSNKEANKMCKTLNALNDENEQLKEENEFAKLLANHRGEMVGFADSLIYDDGSDEMQEMWKSFKDKMFTEWKKKRGIE